MGVVFGRFAPAPGYASVRSVFRLFSEERFDEYFAARQQLQLQVFDSRGRAIAAYTVHVEDFTDEAGPGEMRLEVVLGDARAWPPTG